MQLEINPQITAQYPNLVLGVVSVRGLDNSTSNPALEAMLRTAQEKALVMLGSTPITEHPSIAPWREAYKSFGAKPKKYSSSIENLLKRVSRGEEIRSINTLVDIYNIVSMSNLVPIGGEDLDKISGDVLLTIAGDNETAVKLLGEAEERPPYVNEVIYKDNIGTICRRWNWKEADRTKLTEQTRNAVVVIEGLPPANTEAIAQALNQLTELIREFCGGEIRSSILDSNKTSAEL